MGKLVLDFLLSQSGLCEDVFVNRLNRRYYIRQKAIDSNYVCWLSATKLKLSELGYSLGEFEASCPLMDGLEIEFNYKGKKSIETVEYSGLARKTINFSFER